jgi:hypothetical protein
VTLDQKKNPISLEGTILISDPVIELVGSAQAPKVFQLRPNAGPARGGNTITVIGKNFGKENNEVLVTVGGVDCLASEWLSSTAVRCTVPNGKVGNEIVRVLVLGVCSEDGPSYTYQFSVVRELQPDRGPIFGGTKLLLIGEALATKETPVEVFVGDVPCLSVKMINKCE